MDNHSQHISRRGLLEASLGATAFALFGTKSSVEAQVRTRRFQVILDTDIGDDIDDTWALGLLLRCPELDVRLALTDFGKPEYRAKLLAKFLQTVGRADIPVGLGVDSTPPKSNPQEAWIKDYDLKQYPGKVHRDGVQALIETVMRSKQPMTILAIGPVTNLAAALEREPRIASRARIVGMHGSVRRGYGNKEKPDAEYNVVCDIKACQKVFAAEWQICITPLDTCGVIDLHSERYQKLLASKDHVATTIGSPNFLVKGWQPRLLEEGSVF